MDAGIFFGHHRRSGLTYTVDEVMRRLRRCGVRCALAASFTSWQYDTDEGNRQTLQMCAATGGTLVPLGVVSPISHIGRWQRMRQLKEDGVRMIAVLNQEIEGQLDEFALRDIVEEAQDLGLALQVGIFGRADITRLGRSIEATSLPVLVRCMVGGSYAYLTEALAVARHAPNVMMDVAFGVQSGAVEMLVETIGSERLFVASGAPLAYEGCSYFQLLAADLSVKQRQDILDRNVERILGLPTSDTVLPEAMTGLLEAPKADTLIHTGSCNVPNLNTGFSDISAEMRRTNTETFVFSSLRGLFDDIEAGAVETEQFLDTDPHGYALVVIDPLRPDETLRQIARYRDNPRFVGLKTIQDDGYEMSLADPRFEVILEAISDVPDWSILAHPPGLREAAIRFPHIRFVCEHSTWAYENLHDLPNVFFDIATSTPLRNQTDIAGLIERVGANRVLFASDAPLMSSAFTLGKMYSLELDDDVLRMVLRDNASRAFPRLKASQNKGVATI